MTLYIGENLKKQRKLRELTQEQLADILGVSFQSVSKWERGEGYPDIETLPTIAEYFGITVDGLMGMNEIRNNADAEKIIARVKENMSKGFIAENIELLEEAVKIHPDNYELLYQYAFNLAFLSVGSETDEYRRNNQKAARIAERILAECTDTKIRNRVQAELCNYYQNSGEEAKALEAADKLPSIYNGSEIVKMNILKGEDLVRLAQNNIFNLTVTFEICLVHLADMDEKSGAGYTWEQKIEIYRIAIAIYGIVFDKGDCNTHFFNLSYLHCDISIMAIRAGDFGLALENLEKAAEYAAEFDGLPDKKPYVSLLVNTLEYNSAHLGKNHSDTACKILFKHLSDSVFDGIRDEPRFKKIEKMLA
ncbi:MAG: helix-turn-helix domain-containing protein [Prevotella sp.]|nr:helix-turn-helix domain-containing protein [Prevotella sp.]